MIIIGEKINGTRAEVAKAIKARDAAFIQELALSQAKGGADYLDVNAGTHPDSEPEDITWLVKTIQGVCDLPLCIDSANPKALQAGIEAADKLPMLNSLSGEKARVEGVLPLAGAHHTPLVVLALDDKGIPATAEGRLEIVRQLVGMCRQAGLADELLFVDPLITTIATDNNSGLTAFAAIRQIHREFPQVHITCGLSNISFGQPCRGAINQAFAALAVGAGLDSAIIDPNSVGLRSVIYSAEMLMGLDPDCLNFNQAYRQGLLANGHASPAANQAEVSQAWRSLTAALQNGGLLDPDAPALPEGSAEQAPQAEAEDRSQGGVTELLAELSESLVKMKRNRVGELTKTLLEDGVDPMAVLDAARDAMAEVGRLFETNEYFVPELILAGRMLKEISEQAKPYLVGEGGDGAKKGKVLIGTVAGDIHDIGKDIVTTMLEINGYEVMDLGVDVPVERFREAAVEFKPDVVALSGFLTLAYDPMRDSIAAIREAGLGDVKFMIGGGQIDENVQAYTNADAFGLDAVTAVRLCDGWLAA